MKALQIILGSIITMSMVVWAGSSIDARFNSDSFMNEAIVASEISYNESDFREVASEEVEESLEVAVVEEKIALENTQGREALFDGKWKVVRHFDAYSDNSVEERKSKNIIIEIQADDNGVYVKSRELFGEDEIDFFYVLKNETSNYKRIAITKKIYGAEGQTIGHEVLELERVKEAFEVVEAKETKKITTKNGIKSGNYKLNKATLSSFSKDILVGDNFVSGEISIEDGKVTNLYFELTNKKGEKKVFGFDIDLEKSFLDKGNKFPVTVRGKDGEYMVYGLVSSTSQESISVSISAGDFHGASLAFYTDAGIDALERSESNVEVIKLNNGNNEEEIIDERRENVEPLYAEVENEHGDVFEQEINEDEVEREVEEFAELDEQVGTEF